MRLNISAIVLSVLAAGSLSMRGATFFDTDFIANPAVGNTVTVTGFFEINSSDQDGQANFTGYNPALHVLGNVFAAFSFESFGNPGDDAATVQVSLSGDTFGGSLPPESYLVISTGNLAGDVIGTARFDLVANGVLQYTISAVTTFDIDFINATLTAQYNERSIGVPDGGSSLLLFGFGMMGLGLLRRKLSA